MSRPLAMALLIAGTLSAPAALADQIPRSRALQMCAANDVGPRTAYGETRDEAAAKRTMFDFTCMLLAEGKTRDAILRYVSADFCDHSHMVNAGLKPCANREEMIAFFTAMAALQKGDTIEFPLMSTVNGEMVTQFGAGVDIWRIRGGKVTDHWDASPPAPTRLDAHDKAFADRMQKQIDLQKRIPIDPAAP